MDFTAPGFLEESLGTSMWEERWLIGLEVPLTVGRQPRASLAFGLPVLEQTSGHKGL